MEQLPRAQLPEYPYHKIHYIPTFCWWTIHKYPHLGCRSTCLMSIFCIQIPSSMHGQLWMPLKHIYVENETHHLPFTCRFTQQIPVYSWSFLVISLFWGCYPVLQDLVPSQTCHFPRTVLKSQEHLKKHETNFRMNITFKYPLEIIIYVQLCKCVYIYTHLSPLVGWCLIMVNLRYLQKNTIF